MHPKIYIHAVRTAVPFHKLNQTTVRDYMKTRPGMTDKDRRFIDKIYSASAISTRHTLLDDFAPDPEHKSGRSLFRQEDIPGTAERNMQFVDGAREGGISLAREVFSPEITPEQTRLENSSFFAGPGAGCLSKEVSPADITHLITVSCTGFSAPGFDIDVQQGLGMQPGLERLHIGFMGCYGAFPALRTARSICLADPKAKVMILGIEFCTLHFQEGTDREDMIANSLFSDGLAALVVSASIKDSSTGSRGTPLYELRSVYTQMIGGGDSMMAWQIGNSGFLMRLSAYVPRLIEENIAGIIDSLCSRDGITRESVTHWAVHPGGRAILDRLGKKLGITANDMRDSYAVLSRYGNMSAVTVYFVLAELIRRLDAEKSPLTMDRVFAAAFGPGLTVESAVLTPLRSREKNRFGVQSGPLPLFLPSVNRRWNRPELMDSPEVDPETLKKTVLQFAGINLLFSAYKRVLKREMFSTMLKTGNRDEWHILDLGCGGGDILRWITRRARRLGLRVRLTGIDPSKRTVEWAKENSRNYPEISYLQASSADLPGLSAETGGFDFILTNHVMHHLYGEELTSFIRMAAENAREGVILNDLRRSRAAYLGYTIYGSILFRGSLAFYDGRLSVLRGFRVNELKSMLKSEPGLEHLKVRRVYPFRIVITG